MSDQKEIYNQVLARLVHKQRLAAGDAIRDCLAQVTPQKDLGQVMLEQGILDFENYLKFHNYIHRLFSQPGGQEKIREILGVPVPAREVQGRIQPVATAPRSVSPEPVARPTQPAPAAAAPAPVAAAPAPQVVVVSEPEEILPEEFRGSTGRGQAKEQPPAQLDPRASLAQILLYARQHNASDVHLSPGSPIILRRFSKLKPVSKENLSAEDLRRIIKEGIPAKEFAIFEACGDLEMALTLEGGGRFRVTLAKQRFGWELAARLVPTKLRTFAESGLPAPCLELTKWAQGLVLITGPMGCGKTTTLATMVEMINQDRSDHIITIEQPIEFVFEPKRCQITQRQVDLHTLSQANALRGALRQDPDIIVISELRDLESISLAVSAAETGHLVLATMNTANAQRTVNRIVDAYPPDEQDVIRNMISETIRGVVSQQLVPHKNGQGLVPAYEILIVTKAISNLIRKNNLHQLPSAMLTGRSLGMQILDESLKKLVQENVIEGEEAFYRATDPRLFKQFAPPALTELYNA